MVKDGADHQPVVLFTKDNMDADTPAPVVNLPHVRFIGAPTSQGIKGSIQGSWYIEISVAVITTAEITVDEALDDIGMKNRNFVIHMECDGDTYWLNSLG